MSLDTTRPAYVIAFTALVSAAFTAGVMVVQVSSRGRVQRNEALFKQRALVQAFDLGDVSKMDGADVAELYEQHIRGPEMLKDPETGRDIETYRATASGGAAGAGRELGVAFLFSGRGFWDQISGVLALTPDLNRVIGLAILSQKETPGLGGRITEPQFQGRFKGLDASPPRDETERFIHITRAEPAGKQDPRYGRTVDAITGATQTSLALDRLINENLRAFRRALAARQRAGPRPQEEE